MKYIGVKIIPSAVAMMLLTAESMLGRTVGFKGLRDENNDAEGYLVEYEDGYQSWSPKDVFEASYRPTNGMTFGLATEMAKKGCKIASLDWNGKRMCSWIIPEKVIDGVKHNRRWVIQNPDGSVSQWTPTGNDSLAENWVVVE